MQSTFTHSTAAEIETTAQDLGPLAWVLDELRKSLESGAKALKRFVRDAESAKGSDLAAIDASQLRIARQQLHQAVGALEMVGMAGPSLVLRAMEAAVQKFIQQPEICTPEAASRIERASFALTEYLEGVLADKPVSSISLFPQYREIQEIIKAERIHPADLWQMDWKWILPIIKITAPAQFYSDATKKIFDLSVLQLMKGKASQAAEDLKQSSIGIALGLDKKEIHSRIFWILSAGYFEAIGNNLLPVDLYVRRAASRILIQFNSLMKGDNTISERLSLDLLFFCAQAQALQAQNTPILSAVRSAYKLQSYKPVNYELIQFGRFDPALLAQARKRIASAKETWSSLCAGDTTKFKLVNDQFSLVSDSLVKLHPPSDSLAASLTLAVDTVSKSAQVPRLELAMEVATSVLYLEAVFEDLDPNDPQLAMRTARLASRLEEVRAGGKPQALETWMEELYSRISDKQTMGSVVGELRVGLNEVEKLLDNFFRQPQDKTILQPVIRQLSQMRGVLSVLGLDHASHAVIRMKTNVETILVEGFDTELAHTSGFFDQLGNNLGALAFLIDMLNYQPALAKKLFIFDEASGELKSLIGRSGKTTSAQKEADSEPLIEVQDDDDDPAVLLVNPMFESSESTTTISAAAAAASASASTITTINEVITDVPIASIPLEASLSNFEIPELESSTLFSVADSEPVEALSNPTIASSPSLASNPVDSKTNAPPDEALDDELLEIFIEEVQEVTENALESVSALRINPGDTGSMTVLRRAFHTLKGSSRMVGLDEFGHAGWSLEQLLNTWLADQKNASPEFCDLCTQSIHAFQEWTSDISKRQASHWKATPFIEYADGLRLHNIYSSSMSFKNHDPKVEIISIDDQPFIEIIVNEPEPLAFQENNNQKEEFSLLANDPIQNKSDSVTDYPVNSDNIADSTFAESADPEIPSFALPVLDFKTIELNAVDSENSNQATKAELLQSDGSEYFDFAESVAKVDESSSDKASSDKASSDNSSQDLLNDPGLYPASLVPVNTNISAEVDPPSTDLDVIQEPLEALEPDNIANSVKTEDTSEFALQFNEEDEQVRIIGDLRIGIPLYNVYLNEADEWSRRLSTELAEWEIDHRLPVSEASVLLAHSLAGSSATVGFKALSEVARALEHALEFSQVNFGSQVETYIHEFIKASDEIRRLLHQFAAGFLKEPDENVLNSLKSIDFHKRVFENDQALLPSTASTAVQDQLPEPLGNSQDTQVLDQLKVDEINTLSVSIAPPVSLPNNNIQPVIIDSDSTGYTVLDFNQYGSDFMRRLGQVLRQWFARPDNTSAPLEVLRVLKSLHESAQKAGALTVAQRARGIESQILSFDAEDLVTAADIEPLMRRFDAMQSVFDMQLQISDLASAANEVSKNYSDTKLDASKVYSQSQSQSQADAQVAAVSEEPSVASAFEDVISSLPEASSKVTSQADGQLTSSYSNLNVQAPPLPEQKSSVIQQAESEFNSEASTPYADEPQASQFSQSALDTTESNNLARTAIFSSAEPDIEDGDDEIDAIDAVDLDLFFIFEEECDELMPQLGLGLRLWSEQPNNQNSRLEVLRVLHTLKGSARLAGALRLGEMTHHMESEIEFLGSDQADSQDFGSLLVRFDAMQATFESLRSLVQTPGFDPVVQTAFEEARRLNRNNRTSSVNISIATPAILNSSTPENPLSTALEPGISPVRSGDDTADLPILVENTVAQTALLSSLSEPLQAAEPVLSDAISEVTVPVHTLVPAPQAMLMKPLRQAATATIRVRAQLLDRMVAQAGEVMITRSRLEAELNQLRSSLNDMSGNLDRLRQQLRDIELQAETQMQSRLAQAKEAQAGFDPLEFDRFTRVQELTRMMAESVNDVATVQRTLQRTLEATEDDLVAQARQTRELQRDLLKTRMVEFESISDRLYRVVRQASKDSGKQVKLDLLGGTIEMDRGMLDRMTPAFEHLLRNCVAHGIEEAAVRLEAGKPTAGLITVHLRQAGNDVSVDFIDDGAGLNLTRIREKAVSLGLIAADKAISNQEIGDLIFKPGFTTASQVTELAGRGIGMDVVRSEIDALGGRIETLTEPGKGTQFKLVLPLTTAVTQVVMIRSGGLDVGVPASLVETVRRLPAKELEQAYRLGEVDVAGESVPFYWSGALLQTSHCTTELPGKTSSIVIFRSAAQRVAMHVDDVLGNQEVVVKNLGPQLSRLPGLAGMSVLASGAVVLIYNPVALATVYGPLARAWTAEKQAALRSLELKNAGNGTAPGSGGASTTATALVANIPLVMVVDDSITVRRVTQRFLQREGFRVVMAADGLQALEKLEGELPSVVLSDIEMPRMDGFDLARNIRAVERLKGLPIIMITSRIAEKHREYAKELGVDHYLGKPYSEEILAALVRNYCGMPAAVPA